MMSEVFQAIYETHKWGGSESRSGPGSSLHETALIRQALPELMRRYQIKSLLDVPCGDWNWMSQVDLGCTYIGGDVVNPLIYANRVAYPASDFRVMDITAELPAAELVLSRDCLVHLPFAMIFKALRAIKVSRATYLLMTHFPLLAENAELPTIGEWRPLNLCLPPFDLPPPVEVIHEGFWEKTLGLWSVCDLAEG